MADRKQQVITIDDFSGGKNEFDLQTLIANNECASGTVNVWAPQKALTKIPGWTTVETMTATGGSLGTIYADDTVNQAYSYYYRVSSALGSRYYPWAQNGNPLGYTTGSVSVSGANLISATGNGTSWSTQVTANDIFRVDASSTAWSLVSSVEDDTHLTLSAALPAAVSTGSFYRILPGMTFLEQTWATITGSWWSSTTADWMQRYDGTGMTRIQSAPRAAFLAVHKNYLFGFRTSTADSRLYWSAINDPTSWPSNNFIDIDKTFGKGAGLISFGNELIIFKTRSMYKLIGDVFDPANPTYARYPIAVPKHFVFNGNATVAIHKPSAATSYESYSGSPGVLIFAAFGAIYAYHHGTFAIQRISKKWYQDLPTTLPAINDVQGSIGTRLGAVSFMDNYLIKGMNYTNGAHVAAGIIDDKGAWWYASNTNDSTTNSSLTTGPFAVVPSTTKAPLLYMGSENNPRIYSWDFVGPPPGYQTNFDDSANNSTQAIPATWISKEFNIEYGHFRRIVIYLAKQTAGTLTFKYSVDQAAATSISIDMTVGRGSVIRKTIDVNQKGSTIQFTITHNTTGQTFQVYGIKAYYEPIEEDRQV